MSNSLWPYMDCSPPGSSVHGILQARILEWVAELSSRGSSWPRDRTWLSCIAGRFFTVWASREDPFLLHTLYILPLLHLQHCNLLLYKAISPIRPQTAREKEKKKVYVLLTYASLEILKEYGTLPFPVSFLKIFSTLEVKSWGESQTTRNPKQ